MNVESKRRSDYGIFDAKVTEFGDVVEKIWGLEAWMAILWIFLGLGTSLELFLKNQGSGYKILDRGLIFQKSKSLCARFLN
jgi:hypothetical protein